MSIIENAKKVLRIEADAIYSLCDRIDHNFVDTVNAIYDSEGRVVVIGMGKSGLIGNKISATLASTGTPSFCVHPAEAAHGDMGMITSKDIVILISNGGETEEIITLIPSIKRLGVPIISITGNDHSTLAKHSDIMLDASIEKEACPHNLAPTTSTTVTAALGDALAISLLEKRNFEPDDFALLHPGGRLGRLLLLIVRDLMHTGDELPTVLPAATMKDVLFEMTSKGLGLTAVITQDGVLQGIITDGDLRRILEINASDFLNLIAGDVMGKNPKTCSEDWMATKALHEMQQYKITSLMTVDAQKKLKGIIHIHDLIRAGIA